MGERISIGQLAESAGVGVETVRYYQRLGLLKQPPKIVGGRRRYAPDQVKRLRFIKRAQSLGFTLTEVASLLALADGHCCADVRSLALRKAQLIEIKLAELAAMQQALKVLIQQCDTNVSALACPIIEALNRD